MNYIGIDGCKAVWVAWVLVNGELRYQIARTLAELYETISVDSYCLIDMPIGFSDADSPDRLCDKAARKLLRPKRGSSVFTVPCREAVFSKDYESACTVNQALTGKKFSKQTWYLTPKIRELEILLSSNTAVSIRESHPEVVFAALSGQPMVHNKKTALGRQERMAVLNALAPKWVELLELAVNTTLRKVAQPDDFIDAFVLMLACQQQHELKSLPEHADFDPEGRRREIVYWPISRIC